MKSFKTYLTEGTDASTLFEGVIATCLSLSSQKEKKFKTDYRYAEKKNRKKLKYF